MEQVLRNLQESSGIVDQEARVLMAHRQLQQTGRGATRRQIEAHRQMEKQCGVLRQNQRPTFRSVRPTLNMDKWVQTDPKRRGRRCTMKDIFEMLSANPDFVEKIAETCPELTSNLQRPVRAFARIGMDGAKYSKKKSVVNLVITFIFFGSKSHSPTLNFDLSKYIGVECEADLRNCFGFGASFAEINACVGEEVRVGNLKFVFDYFVVADAKCLYCALPHASFNSAIPSLWCKHCAKGLTQEENESSSPSSSGQRPNTTTKKKRANKKKMSKGKIMKEKAAIALEAAKENIANAHEPSGCSLWTNVDFDRCVELAKNEAKRLGFKRDESTGVMEWSPTENNPSLTEVEANKRLKTFILEQNHGINHLEGIKKDVDIEKVFADTFHLKENVSNQMLMGLFEVGTVMLSGRRIQVTDNESDDVGLQSRINRFCAFLANHGIMDKSIRKLCDGDVPTLLGSECIDLFRIFVNVEKLEAESRSDHVARELSVHEQIGDLLINTGGSSTSLEELRQLPAIGAAPIWSFFSEERNMIGNECDEGSYFRNLMVAMYAFIAANKELVSLETNDDRIERLRKLCSIFRKAGSLSRFSNRFTLYFHLLSQTMPELVNRFYTLTGCGYGYCSMQGVENVNKWTKDLLMHKTNLRFNTARYDALVAVCEMRYYQFVYGEFDLDTPGEKRRKSKAEKLHSGRRPLHRVRH